MIKEASLRKINMSLVFLYTIPNDEQQYTFYTANPWKLLLVSINLKLDS